jgi:hypothetical protein
VGRAAAAAQRAQLHYGTRKSTTIRPRRPAPTGWARASRKRLAGLTPGMPVAATLSRFARGLKPTDHRTRS